MSLDPQEISFFKSNGYLVLGKILDDEELRRYQEIYDRDREEMSGHWYGGGDQTMNCDALVTSPEFDGIIRHPRVLPPLRELMGGEVCFSELCIRHMAPYEGELSRAWHRDRPHWPDHPHRMDYAQLMVYLTDVDETTHCFSISPEAVDEEILGTQDHLARGGVHDLHGPAGTGILFNVSVIHTATVRSTERVRKSVQIYYGHRDRPHLSEDSLMPTELWRDHENPEVRGFYGVLNGKTRKYIERAAHRDEISPEEMRVILLELDIESGKRKEPS